jgi:hypothetical protein
MPKTKPNVGKEFGEVPPSLNKTGELFKGGSVPAGSDVVVDAIKGMVPAALPKIPLTQPAQGQTGTSDGNQVSSTNSGSPSSSEKK